MVEQDFSTAAELLLRVQGPWPGLPNLVANPFGRWNVKGWTAGASAAITRTAVNPFDDDPGALHLLATAGGGATNRTVESDKVEIPLVTAAGTSARARLAVTLISGGLTRRVRHRFYNAAGALISSSAYASGAGVGNLDLTAAVPVNTKFVALEVDFLNAGGIAAGNSMDFKRVAQVVGPTATVAAQAWEWERPWTNVIGVSNEISFSRTPLNVNTMTARILDSALDPASVDLIRKGAPVQFLTNSSRSALFVGEVLTGAATYDFRDPLLPDSKRTQITMTVADSGSTLANVPWADGVATIEELKWPLQTTNVPWLINGQESLIDPGTVTVVAVNESASVLDQAALTRDSRLGFAWISAGGIFRAEEAAGMPSVSAAAYDEADYSDLVIDFDPERCINVVSIKLVRINPGTGETEEVSFGPWVDQASIDEWGPRSAEFTVHGVLEADLDDLAAAVLTANATPVAQIQSITIPVGTLDQLEALATRDLYDLITVSNTRAGLTHDARIASISHRISISSSEARHAVTFGFAEENRVELPQVPPPLTPTTGTTLAELLRPVGEVTMWFGAKADCPPGWLVLDGSTVTDMATTYPKLYALNGNSDVLPDWTDRFPIGAGTKALGTSGGSSTKAIGMANLPPITVRYNNDAVTTGAGRRVFNVGESTGGTGGTAVQFGGGTPLDVLNPWRALWFIIRAA